MLLYCANSFNLLNTCYMSGTVVGTSNSREQHDPKISALLKLTFWWGTCSINPTD